MAATMLTRHDIQALKDYVTAPGNLGQNQADSTVRLHVTHSNLKAEFIELRLDLHVRVHVPSHLKESCVGASCPAMHAHAALKPDRQPITLPQMTVDAAKFKLSSHCGTPASDMVLQLKNSAGALVATLLEGQRKLGYFSPQDGCAHSTALCTRSAHCFRCSMCDVAWPQRPSSAAHRLLSHGAAL